MKEVKCFWCKEKSPKDEMKCEEKPTGKFNKNGTEKMSRKYFHVMCFSKYEKDMVFRKQELEDWDALYSYLLNLHKLEVLDGRMIERIQDLRNGTIKLNGKKIKKYKMGVSYKTMLQTYKYTEDKFASISNYKNFETEWNEFTYFFGTMTNNITEVRNTLIKVKKQEESQKNIIKKNINLQESQEVKVVKNKKKDELDISDFL